MTTESLKQTPLHDTHAEAGARMVPFSGWDMPVQYPAGIISEVRSVRTSAGMFDVSHMARIEFSGPDAVRFLDTLLSANVAGLRQGRSKYHVICDEQGGIIDDAIVYRLADDYCLLVVNAGNAEADMAWIRSQARSQAVDAGITVTTDATAMIAVQGPESVAILDQLSGGMASPIRRFRIGEIEVAGISCRAARTGYTGEDGFEIMPASTRAAELWSAIEQAGVAECGLGARDVLRLEAGLMLHGSDMTVDNNPYEAGLDWVLYLNSEGYVPGPALRKIAEAGTERIIAGFRMTGRGIPRHGMNILKEGEVVGVVTSGTHSPTLGDNIGIGYLNRILAVPATSVEIDVRGRLVEAEVAPLPFYRPGGR